MLYRFLLGLQEQWSALNVFRYLTFRSFLAFFVALVFVLIFQPRFIRWFRSREWGQPIRDDGPASHFVKKGTPTMGGLVVIVGVVLATLLLADPRNILVWVVLYIMIGNAWLGFVDDFRKVKVKTSKGVSARGKLLVQFAIALTGVAGFLYFQPEFSTSLSVPFFKTLSLELGWFFVPFAALVIVGASNAVNLTDGLDGLVIGPVMTVAFAYGVFAYVSGNVDYAKYLQIPYVVGAGDLAIFSAALIGGGLGFLWYNCFPAQVFMGDVGALAFGGALGTLAVLTKQELVLPIAGLVFVVEAMSVILQVGSYKLRKKRIFRMAPLHHHFELAGYPEPKIIVRAWIISILLALVSIATLKLR